MTDMFLELCARECAAHVQRMFDHAPRIPGTGMAERPIVGGKFLLGLPLFPELVQEVCAALRAASSSSGTNRPGHPCHCTRTPSRK